MLLAGVLLGFLVCKYTTPAPKPIVQVVEKIVTQTNTKTVTKEITRPDGTKETLITSDTSTNTKSDMSASNSYVLPYKYKFSPMLGYSFTQNKQTYGVMAEKYLSPGLTAGIYMFPFDKHAGLTLSLSF